MNQNQEQYRLEALKLYDILNTWSEPAFDDIVAHAAKICHVPIAVISIVNDTQLWFKSAYGLDLKDTPKECSFCAHTITQNEVYEIKDTHQDPLFVNSPFVTNAPHIRFYAGAPLKDATGIYLGALAVMDTKPGEISIHQKEHLLVLANAVMSLLELRKEQKNSDLYKQALSTVCAFGILNSNLVYEYVNEPFCNLSGYQIQEIIGKNITDIKIAQFSYQEEIEIVNELNKGITINKNIKNKSKDGTTSWSKLTLLPYLNSDGNILKVFSIRNDITNEIKALERLEKSEAKYRALVEESAQMSFTTDEHGVFTYASIRLKEHLGYDDSEVIGKKFPFIYNDEWLEKVTAFYTNQFETQTTETQFTFPVLTKDNRKIWLEQYATLIVANNKYLGFRCILHDVTDRVLAEEAHNEALRLANEARVIQKNFLNKVSHEMRTPMNGVVGMANLLKDTTLSDNQKVFVDNILESANNMLHLLNELLDVAKLENGMVTYQDTEFDLRQLLHNISNRFKQDIEAKKLWLAVHINNQIPTTLYADKQKLNQILLNILGNAVKFTNTGSITLTATVKKRANDTLTLEFKIADTGIGIAAENIDTIFESFAQADNNTDRRFGGTGLGLSIAKQLIELQGGSISVQSTYGLGSIFTFTFHVGTSSKSTNTDLTDQKQNIKNSLNGVLVLLVEDNIINQKVATFTLENWGANVTVVDRGQKAISALTLRNFDLILMDIQMPEMDGLATTRYIRSRLFINTPILAMTASAMPGEKEKCLEAGMNNYIAKPFEPNELNIIISALLKEHKAIAQLNTSCINFKYLDELTDGDQDFLKEIFATYLVKTPELIDQSFANIDNKHWKELKAAIHSLKNSVGIIGATKIFDKLSVMELNITDSGISTELVEEYKSETIPMIFESIAQVRHQHTIMN